MNSQITKPQPSSPLDLPAVIKLEDALRKSPTKTILLEINSVLYQLSREGNWLKFSRLTKKRMIKRSTLFETMADVYNQAVHGSSWRISPI